MPVVKTEPQPAVYREEEGIVETMGTEVSSMEESYVEECYDDYGGYEGQGYDGGDGQEYTGQVYAGDGAAGQKGLEDVSSFITIGYNEAGLKMFTCQMCGKSFKKNAHVKRHIENVHTGAQVQCGVCNKILKNKETLFTHSRVQHGLTKDQTFF